MSQAADILTTGRTPYIRVVGAVSAAHFVSHYYIILLAPLLPLVRAEYRVTYTEIGLAFAAFNIVTAALQTPAGFLVDRLGARALLVAGLAIGASAFVVAGLVDSFWVLVAMFALAGVGNTVITRPTMRYCRSMCRRIALVRHFRSIHLPACSVLPLRR